MSTPASIPYRQISRIMTEVSLCGDVKLLEIFPERYSEALLFIAVARTCSADWINRDTIARPDDPTRFSSINALAQSLGRPATSARRHANHLMEEGRLWQTSEGLALAATDENEELVVDFFEQAHDLFVRLVEDSWRTCDLPWPATRAEPFSLLKIVNLALDLRLMPMQTFGGLSDNWPMFMLWNAVAAANIDHVTYDPVLARRYAIDSSPDELRAPITLRAASALIGQPYATAWRYTQTLEQLGLISSTPAGLVITSSQLRGDAMDEVVNQAVDYTVRAMRDAALAGIDPAAAARSYRRGRPELERVGHDEPIDG